MKELAYQQKAVNELTEKAIGLLNTDGTRHKLVFKAPTGSGKTVMACEMLAHLVDDLQECPSSYVQEVAFIWFAPRKLHLQSYHKLLQAYEENRRLTPVMFDDLDQSEGIQPGEILFVNWESVYRDDCIMAREGESSTSIYEIARRTREEQGLPIVAIIDEEHMFWTKTADKSAKVLERIDPKVEIRISATPKTRTFDVVNVPRHEVIAAEMIKKEIVLNPDITIDISDERTLNEHLLNTALRKRKQLQEAYQTLGININPLLLIQLPNDTSESMTVEEVRIAEQVKTYLSANPKWDISVDNGRLAVWLANEKQNLTGLEKPDNMVQVLLFKEAIALGWDCPRAAVLLIFRNMQSFQFTTQTVGRIMRMPEQKHYPIDMLNVGYVYTDIAKEQIQIVAADASYITTNAAIAYRIPNLQNVSLPSVYSERPSISRNRLQSDFKTTLFETAEEFFKLERGARLFSIAELAAMREDADVPTQLPETDDELVNENRLRAQKIIRLDVTKINAEIPVDVHFQNEEQIIDVNRVKYARTAGEIDRVFMAYLSTKGNQFESKGRTDKISMYLLEMLEEYFGIIETDAKKIVLYYDNRPVFDRLLEQALDKYVQKRQKKLAQTQTGKFTDVLWQVPEERVYDTETNHEATADAHAMQPFYQLNNASTPERNFEQYLEANREYIDWWYKNGDHGKQHYAIKYISSGGKEELFYVDFVIRMKNGHIYLFDTKGANGDIDTDVVEKHNALIDYIASENKKNDNGGGGTLRGGVIKQSGLNWLFSPLKIDDAQDTTNWGMFIPRNA